MNTAIVPTTVSISEDQYADTTWLRYFDPKKALKGLNAHLGGLPSSDTPERYTRRNYIRGILYFLEWNGGAALRLPTEQVIKEFIAHLKHEKEWTRGNVVQNGVSSTTVANNYLAPLRIFLKQLKNQSIHVHGAERDFVMECKSQIETAMDVPNPAPDKKSNIAPLWNPKFTRLNINQVNLVLESLDQTTITGARDYTLMRLMFESALRVAEIRRITPNSIKPEDNHYLITVRGKRTNIDPIAISTDMYHAIKQYIQLYNAPLADDDPRRINDNTPIFQAMRKGDTHPEIDGIYSPAEGLSYSAIRYLIKKHTSNILGEDFACAPHDCRRTFAYIAYTQGMDIRDISKALRHADIAITWKYIGIQPDHGATLLTNFVKIA